MSILFLLFILGVGFILGMLFGVKNVTKIRKILLKIANEPKKESKEEIKKKIQKWEP